MYQVPDFEDYYKDLDVIEEINNVLRPKYPYPYKTRYSSMWMVNDLRANLGRGEKDVTKLSDTSVLVSSFDNGKRATVEWTFTTVYKKHLYKLPVVRIAIYSPKGEIPEVNYSYLLISV